MNTVTVFVNDFDNQVIFQADIVVKGDQLPAVRSDASCEVFSTIVAGLVNNRPLVQPRTGVDRMVTPLTPRQASEILHSAGRKADMITIRLPRVFELIVQDSANHELLKLSIFCTDDQLAGEDEKYDKMLAEFINKKIEAKKGSIWYVTSDLVAEALRARDDPGRSIALKLTHSAANSRSSRKDRKKKTPVLHASNQGVNPVQIIVNSCRGNTLCTIGIDSEELVFDGTSTAHNSALADIINRVLQQEGYNDIELDAEDIKEMLEKVESESDKMILTLLQRYSCPSD